MNLFKKLGLAVGAIAFCLSLLVSDKLCTKQARPL